MASGDNARKIVKLRSSDGILFEVDEAVARQYSQSIGNLIEDDCATGVIPIYNVTGRILRMLREYMENHANATNNGVFGGPDPVVAQRLKKWDAEFIDVDTDTLFDLLDAADYLNVSSLSELTVKTIACDYTPKRSATPSTLFVTTRRRKSRRCDGTTCGRFTEAALSRMQQLR